MFLLVENIDCASYAGDKTIYNAGDNIDEVKFSLQESSENFFEWSADNQTKNNIGKCHLIASTNDIAKIQIVDFSIKSSSSGKLLGVNIDNKFNFDSHVNHSCSKASKK